ncbi:MAG: CapA family protein [bacterium]|nr:CapA family protein [bacterium]
MKTILWLSAVVIITTIFVFFVTPAGEIVIEKSVSAMAPKPVTALMFGDMMLDRAVREKIDEYGPAYPFEKIKQLFPGHDIVVANAEGAFTDNASVSAPDHSIMRFTFTKSLLPTLRSLGLTVLSQANNHTLDFGQSGLASSKDAMEQNGIASFGDPFNNNPGPLYVSVRNETVAFVGYHQFYNPDASTTLAAITQAHATGAFVTVYPHWGEEYNLGTTPLQTKLAHEFIDAGADAVLGSHPHVVEPVEIYKGRAIFYSMGNFVFDQYWHDDVTHGLAVEISLTKTEVSYTMIPFVIQNMQPTPTGETKSFVLQR